MKISDVWLMIASVAAFAMPCTADVAGARGGCVLVEAEGFAHRGGWVLDPQFMDQMGSPYLLAHGLGRPVADATTEINFTEAGEYRVWVRTKDWVAQWKAPGAPGKFEVAINGAALKTIFGTEGAQWHWQDGGTVQIPAGKVRVALHDLIGFEGRCDAILFSRDANFEPPNRDPEMAAFRRACLGLPGQPDLAGDFDFVVTGGGIAGTCAAISAARLGLKVALIQDRPVLGGNNSSEVRVWLQGARNKEPWPRIGDVVSELEQPKRAHYGPSNTAELYEDEKKLEVVCGETNLTLFLEHRANAVVMSDGKIRTVIAQEIKTGRRLKFDGRWFADCTGDAAVGALAGADFEMEPKGRMGPCNLWNVCECKNTNAINTDVVASATPQPFPRCPWALDLTDRPFPGRSKTKPETDKLGGWYWESGFDRDPIEEMEYIRDWNFRAMYGAWDAMKNVDKVLPNHRLNWAAYILGKRESRRLMGDVVLTFADLTADRKFPDGCAPTGWSNDLHLPDPKFEKGFEGDAFISRADFGQFPAHREGRPFWIPFRCLYSRNIANLFMAGRDISVKHEALGAVRVMRTGGCMGEVVGMAASVCKQHDATPREVYEKHLAELQELMKRGTGKNPETAPDYENQGEGKTKRAKAVAATKQSLATPEWIKNAGTNLARSAHVKVSGSKDAAANPPSLLNDGKIDLADNNGRWISDAKLPNTVEFTWDQPREIGSVRIVSGYRRDDGTVYAPVRDFVFKVEDRGAWHVLAKSEGNERVDWSVTGAPIRTSKVRLEVTQTPGDTSRIWEIEIYGPATNAP